MLKKHGKLILVLVIIAGLGAVALWTTHKWFEHKYKRSRRRRRITPRQLQHIMTNKIHRYIIDGCIDKHDCRMKERYIRMSLHDHVRRKIMPLIMIGANIHAPADFRLQAVGIAEKVCGEHRIQLKPRCDMHTHRFQRHWGHRHWIEDEEQGTAIPRLYLNYQHAPRPDLMIHERLM